MKFKSRYFFLINLKLQGQFGKISKKRKFWIFLKNDFILKIFFIGEKFLKMCYVYFEKIFLICNLFNNI